MKISKQIELILNKFKTKVEKEILKGNFKKIREKENLIRIMVLDEVVDVWNIEDIDVCLYKVVINEIFGEDVKFLGNSGKFKNPKKLRKILVGAKQC